MSVSLRPLIDILENRKHRHAGLEYDIVITPDTFICVVLTDAIGSNIQHAFDPFELSVTQAGDALPHKIDGMLDYLL